jgi:hypothetical protein
MKFISIILISIGLAACGSDDNQESILEESQESISEKSQEPISEESQEPISEESQEPISEESQEPISEESQEPISEESQETFLEGSWLSLCEDYSEEGTRYGQSTFTLNNSNLEVVNRTYDSTSCEGETFATILTASGNISIEEEATLASGQVVTQFKINLTEMTLVYNQQNEVDDENSRAYCSYTDWEVGVSKNVLICRFGSDTTILDIAIIDGNNLFFGEYVDAGYPTELEGQAYTKL